MTLEDELGKDLASKLRQFWGIASKQNATDKHRRHEIFLAQSLRAQREAREELRALGKEAAESATTDLFNSFAIIEEMKEKQKAVTEKLGQRLEALKLRMEQDAPPEVEERQVLYGQLVGPQETRTLDTQASVPPPVYYVIAGRGSIAMINHTTLRQSEFGQERLKGHDGKPLTVLHIGLPDPWFYYHAHGMGQPPYLLQLPGMHFRPTSVDRTIRSGLHSNDFAYKTLQEWSILKLRYEFPHVEGWVAVLQKRDSGAWKVPDAWDEFPLMRQKILDLWDRPWPTPPAKYPFRLYVVLPDESIKVVYAQKVDLCVGIGRAYVDRPVPHSAVEKGSYAARGGTKTIPAALKKDLQAANPLLWTPPEMWDQTVRDRKIVTGPEALTSQSTWSGSHRVFVNGGGGIGLNMIERAEDVGCRADWMHYQTLHGSFNLERNDTVLKDPSTGGAREPGTSGYRTADMAVLPRDRLTPALLNTVPCQKEWRFGRDGSIEPYGGHVTKPTDSGGRLAVNVPGTRGRIVGYYDEYNSTYSPGASLSGGAFPFSATYQEDNSDLSPEVGTRGLFDRVFCTGGLANNALGTPKLIMGTTASATFAVTQIMSTEGRAVGLETEGGAVRVLGGAATFHPDWDWNAGTTQAYFDSLPVSAVPVGFVFCGLNTALANEFFKADRPNRNANTGTRAEVLAQLKEAGVPGSTADLAAKAIVDLRRRVNGFETREDLVAKVRAEAARFKDEAEKIGKINATAAEDLRRHATEERKSAAADAETARLEAVDVGGRLQTETEGSKIVELKTREAELKLETGWIARRSELATEVLDSMEDLGAKPEERLMVIASRAQSRYGELARSLKGKTHRKLADITKDIQSRGAKYGDAVYLVEHDLPVDSVLELVKQVKDWEAQLMKAQVQYDGPFTFLPSEDLA